MEIPSPEDEQEESLSLPEWLLALDEELSASAASAAERAFGMGCTVSLAPMLIIIGLVFLLGARHWVSLLLVGLLVILLATSWAVYVALQAHRKGPPRTWRESVRAKTETGLAARGITRERLVQEVDERLPKDAPLRRAVHGEYE